MLHRTFDSRPARFLGEISYGVFLWHFPVAVVLASELSPAPTIVGLLAFEAARSRLPCCWRP